MPTPVVEAQAGARGLRRETPRAEPMVWLCGGAVVLALSLLVALLLLLAGRGLTHFWPRPLVLLQEATAGEPAQLGTILDRDAQTKGGVVQLLLHRGGREFFDSPLLWIEERSLASRSLPRDALALERYSEGMLFGFLDAVRVGDVWLSYAGLSAAQQVEALEDLRKAAQSSIAESQYRLRLASGAVVELPAAELRSAHAPNAMTTAERVAFLFDSLGRFLSESPRRSNVQGGVFPAIIGTVTLVLLMAIIVAPLGVLAAIYLQEYAQRGPVTRLVRIAVNNLAGVPSIVYGVFGLGFLVYTLGGSLDRLLFADTLPAPTLGTPGMFWAALTMALLTLPVVVVTTEEGLARVPVNLREGSYALGATRAETLWRVILPAASPAVLTGLILAVARATGEVAPLILVGVAKYAPGLPVDGEFPYLHLDRQFMHLGFYIYDLGFQSPEIVTAEGLVFATALLLVLIVLLLNTAAVILRGRLREAFRPDETL